MRIRSFLALSLLCCCLLTTALAQNGEDPLTKKVDQLFATWDKPESPGAAIAVIKDGAVVYKHGTSYLLVVKDGALVAQHRGMTIFS